MVFVLPESFLRYSSSQFLPGYGLIRAYVNDKFMPDNLRNDCDDAIFALMVLNCRPRFQFKMTLTKCYYSILTHIISELWRPSEFSLIYLRSEIDAFRDIFNASGYFYLDFCFYSRYHGCCLN